MPGIKATIGKDGRIVIPAEFRKKMGLKPGDDVVIAYKDGDIKITTLERVVRRAQEMVKRHNPEGRSLVDDLIADRRNEAARE